MLLRLKIVFCLVLWCSEEMWSQQTQTEKHVNPHFDIITAPSIVNDGVTENSFTIGIFNPQMDKPLKLTRNDALHFWFVTADELASQTSKRPWALSSSDLMKKVPMPVIDRNWTVTYEEDISKLVSGRPDLQGWKAVPQNDVTLGPGEHIEFKVTGLQSNQSDGYTSVYFYYPGYINEDKENSGIISGPILKSPAVSRGQRLGVGTSDPQAQVHVFSKNDNTDVLLETQGGDNAWVKLRMQNKTNNWFIRNGSKAEGNGLIIGESKIDFSNPNKFTLDPQGNAILSGLLTTGNGVKVNGANGLYVEGLTILKDKLQVDNGLDVYNGMNVQGSGTFQALTGITVKNGINVADGGMDVNGGLNVNSGDLKVAGATTIGTNSPPPNDIQLTTNGRIITAWKNANGKDQGGVFFNKERTRFVGVEGGAMGFKRDGGWVLNVDEDGGLKVNGSKPIIMETYTMKNYHWTESGKPNEQSYVQWDTPYSSDDYVGFIVGINLFEVISYPGQKLFTSHMIIPHNGKLMINIWWGDARRENRDIVVSCIFIDKRLVKGSNQN